jgi:hypothetical protein
VEKNITAHAKTRFPVHLLRQLFLPVWDAFRIELFVIESGQLRTSDLPNRPGLVVEQVVVDFLVIRAAYPEADHAEYVVHDGCDPRAHCGGRRVGEHRLVTESSARTNGHGRNPSAGVSW